MKFETPRININVFSEDILTVASGIKNSNTVNATKGILENSTNNVAADNILTFTID